MQNLDFPNDVVTSIIHSMTWPRHGDVSQRRAKDTQYVQKSYLGKAKEFRQCS